MRKPKCHEIQYIDFLIASPVTVSCCEASRSDPRRGLPAAHDSYTRLLHRLEPDPETLYQEVEPLIHKQLGALVIDDSLQSERAIVKSKIYRAWEVQL